MYRPPRPEMVNYNHYRNQTPHNPWRPMYRPHVPAQFQRRGAGYKSFRAPFLEPQNNDEHWCETCDRAFPTNEILEKHKQQHQKCNIDGCQFVAHPKVITKHIQMQHSTGLYKKISKLDNPEEIQKWREERKKRYPTKANIDKKAAERREKIERGEKMALKYQNGVNRQKSEGNMGTKRKHSFDKGNQNKNKIKININENNPIKCFNTKPPPRKVAKTVPTVEEKNKLKPFAGILNIMLDEKEQEIELEHNTFIEDEDEVIISKDIAVQQEPAICGALSSLICDYGSSDEEADKIEVVNPILDSAKLKTQSNKNDLNSNKQQDNLNSVNHNQENHLEKDCKIETICPAEPVINKSDDDSGPEETTIVKNDDKESEHGPEKIVKCKPVSLQKDNFHKNRQRQTCKPRHKIPSTLLQKLLSKEIRHERNVVLQCIRYIRKNNYFDNTIK